MMGMKDHFSSFARYNAWANRRLYDAAAQLSDADYRADRGAFFKSMHGTLNHLLTADWVWMHRFTGQGPSPTFVPPATRRTGASSPMSTASAKSSWRA